jgi:hypothetical protein
VDGARQLIPGGVATGLSESIYFVEKVACSGDALLIHFSQ